MVGEITEERVANAMRKALPVSQTPLSSSRWGRMGSRGHVGAGLAALVL